MAFWRRKKKPVPELQDSAPKTPDPGTSAVADPESATAPSQPPDVTGEPPAALASGVDSVRPSASADPPAETMEERILEAIKRVYDPEIPVNIYELGLVYDVAVDAAGAVAIKMTLTSPNCPEAQSLPPEVEERVKQVAGVSDASVEIVWEPPWSPERMSEAARLELGML